MTDGTWALGGRTMAGMARATAQHHIEAPSRTRAAEPAEEPRVPPAVTALWCAGIVVAIGLAAFAPA
jgi:hypothetical protein